MERHRSARPGGLLLPPLLLLASLLLVAAGCDAPRDNFLDPKSPDFNPVGSGETNDRTEFPRVDIRAIHDESVDSETSIDRLEIGLGVTDHDGIEFVQIEVADTLRLSMNRQNQDRYNYTFYPTRFFRSIYDFSESPFRFVVYDSKGNVAQSEPYSIVRILSHPPEIVQPTPNTTNFQNLSSNPLIIWKDDNSSFFVEYWIIFYQSDRPVGTNKTVLKTWTRIPRIITPPDSNNVADDGLDSFRLASFIPPDTTKLYQVILSLRDRHGNEALSKTHFFFVE